jgi:hypothetical protein
MRIKIINIKSQTSQSICGSFSTAMVAAARHHRKMALWD